LNAVITAQDNILIGDFNIPDVDFETQSGSSPGLRLIDFIENKFMIQKVTLPTRGNNILDLLFCTDDTLVGNVEVGESLGMSDHNSIRFDIKFEKRITANDRAVPNFRMANFEGMRAQLDPFVFRPDTSSVEESVKQFMPVLEKAEASGTASYSYFKLKRKPFFGHGKTR